jgi:hypothetical protein
MSTSPYISNCNYDGAGAVLQWMYGSLNARNTGTLTGSVVYFAQTGEYGAAGMDTSGYLYVPANCQSGSAVCKLHVALHGCLQSYSNIQMDFIQNTGYNMWAGKSKYLRKFDLIWLTFYIPQILTTSSSSTLKQSLTILCTASGEAVS